MKPEYYQTDAFKLRCEEAAKHDKPLTAVFIKQHHSKELLARLRHYGRGFKCWPVGEARIVTTEDRCPCCGASKLYG